MSPPVRSKYVTSPPPRANSTPPANHHSAQQQQRQQLEDYEYSQLLMGMNSVQLSGNNEKMVRQSENRWENQGTYIYIYIYILG
jgi:hypothetical protein